MAGPYLRRFIAPTRSGGRSPGALGARRATGARSPEPGARRRSVDLARGLQKLVEERQSVDRKELL